jgi:hypothetical protein
VKQVEDLARILEQGPMSREDFEAVTAQLKALL